MIEESLVARLMEIAGSSKLFVSGEWISNGRWAVRSTARPDVETVENFVYLHELVRRAAESAKTETSSMNVERVKSSVFDDREDCKNCKGSGLCTCSCGDVHPCGTCDGDGKIGDDESVKGWAILRTGDERFAINDSYLELLDGLDVVPVLVSDEPWKERRFAVGGMNYGELDVIIMPMNVNIDALEDEADDD